MSDVTLDHLLAVASRAPVAAYGAPPALAALVAARVAGGGEPLVVVLPDEAAAARLAEDIAFFLPPGDADRVVHVPAIDTSPYAELSPDRRAVMQRLAALFRLSHGDGSDIVVLSALSLMRRTLPPDELSALTDVLIAEEEIDRDRTVDLLVRAGYARVPVVEDPGTFAV
ncbi:MAG: hypothetical protein D6689_23010, partial [Deltaproteobacteria bacterium]